MIQKKELQVMLRFMLAGFSVLTISIVACICTCEAESISLDQIDSLLGKADPKFKCVELCTSTAGVCVSNGTTCNSSNSGIHCGDKISTKKSYKGCEEDSAGGQDPCVNGDAPRDNVNCYRIYPCSCIAVLVGQTVVYGCKVPAGAKLQDSGAVVKSSDCS